MEDSFYTDVVTFCQSNKLIICKARRGLDRIGFSLARWRDRNDISLGLLSLDGYFWGIRRAYVDRINSHTKASIACLVILSLNWWLLELS